MSGFPAWANRGARVICVKTGKWRRGQSLSLRTWISLLLFGTPIYGGCYVIEGCGWCINDPHIKLKGFAGWYHLDNFRPVVPAKSEADDLAIFRPILDQVPETA